MDQVSLNKYFKMHGKVYWILSTLQFHDVRCESRLSFNLKTTVMMYPNKALGNPITIKSHKPDVPTIRNNALGLPKLY